MSKPLRGRAAAEAAAKAQDLAKVALAQRDAREGASTGAPHVPTAVPAMPLAMPPMQPAPAAPTPASPLSAPARAAPVDDLPLQTPGSAVQLQDAAQLRGGPVPMVPWYSGISGDAPVLAKAEVEKVRKLRDEFEGASAEYRVLSQVAVAGMTTKEGKTLQKRFKELEQAWGAFQWNQKSRSLNPTTREEVQAASAALAAQPKGVDLEHEVESVLAELWDSLEKPAKPSPQPLDPQLDEELDRLEAYIEARIQEEERAEREGREAKSRPKLEVCSSQSEVLGDMSAKFQTAYPIGLDEGTGGTPMTSYTTALEEVHVLPGSGAWFDKEVQHLSREVHSVSDKLNKEMVSRRRPVSGSAYLGDLAGGSGPSLHDSGPNAWGNVFAPARTPMEARPRPLTVRQGARNGY